MASTGITRSLAAIMTPLTLALESRPALELLLDDLGWGVELTDAQHEAINALLPIADALEVVTSISGEETAGATVEEVLAAAADVWSAIGTLSNLSPGTLAGLPSPLDTPQTWADLALALPEYLVLRWLQLDAGLIYALAYLAGAITENEEQRPRARWDWAALGTFLSDPTAQLASVYGWGDRLDHERLLDAVWGLGSATGLAGRSIPVRPELGDDVVLPEGSRGLEIEVHRGWSADRAAFFLAGLLVMPVEDRGEVRGMLVTTELIGEAGGSVDLGAGWTLSLAGGGDASGALGVVLLPGRVAPASTAARPGASIRIDAQPEVPWALGGEAGALRLELDGLEGGLSLLGTTSDPELVLDFRLGADSPTGGVALVVAPDQGDSFLADVLGFDALTARVAPTISWSSRDGVALAAGVGFEVVIPLGIRVGPLELQQVRLALAGEPDGAVLEAAMTGTLTFGPFSATIEDIGVRALASSAREAGTGELGPFDVALGFKPPNGFGLAINVEGVSGGGFLTHDPELGRYVGAAEVEFYGTGLTAIGIVTTQMPDGGEGWSMFLTLGIRFVGVQLGFGFTLNGVGGLVGVNRGLDDDALGDAVRTGSLDAILFPDDPLVNTMQIVRDIDSVFPAADGQYMFGPVVKIGWGSPTLIEIDVGIVLQLPDPLTVSLLGALSADLPTEDEALVSLHAEFAGTVNITEGSLKIDASLSGSQIAGIEITGDMAVRADFLGEPTFLVAFGGFHPEFDEPCDFPALEPVGIALDTGDELRITLGGYFALTSNTIQFGSAAEVYAEAVGFTAEGGTSFDALITFKPFGFDIAMKAWMSITAGSTELMGVLLSGTLSGPSPWHAAGEAEFRLLGMKARLEIEATIGARGDDVPATLVDVLDVLCEELEREDSWSVLPPAGATPVIVSDNDDALALDPSGRVQVVQRIVPLEHTIEQYGNAQPSAEDHFTVTAVGFAAEEVESVDDYFASAQFFRLDEDEKLSSPSFTLMPAGLTLGGAGVDAPDGRELTYDHEVVYRDPNGGGDEESNKLYKATDLTMERALASRNGAAPSQSYTVGQTRFVLADPDTGASSGVATDFFAARSTLTGERVILPEYELELIA
jgi:hypothetical protein